VVKGSVAFFCRTRFNLVMEEVCDILAVNLRSTTCRHEFGRERFGSIPHECVTIRIAEESRVWFRICTLVSGNVVVWPGWPRWKSQAESKEQELRKPNIVKYTTCCRSSWVEFPSRPRCLRYRQRISNSFLAFDYCAARIFPVNGDHVDANFHTEMAEHKHTFDDQLVGRWGMHARSSRPFQVLKPAFCSYSAWFCAQSLPVCVELRWSSSSAIPIGGFDRP